MRGSKITAPSLIKSINDVEAKEKIRLRLTTTKTKPKSFLSVDARCHNTDGIENYNVQTVGLFFKCMNFLPMEPTGSEAKGTIP